MESFFAKEAPRIADLCRQMASRFSEGGRLLAFGAGSAATDAQHISVEFVHPVIVGKRALPAMALVNDAASVSALALGAGDEIFSRQLEILGASKDIAVGIVHGAHDDGLDAVTKGLESAAVGGMLTVSLTASGVAVPGKYRFEVDSEDPFVVQEVHETLYHVVWELVHVLFEHESSDAGGSLIGEPSGFLYPFLSEAEPDLQDVLEEVAGSVKQKAGDVIELRQRSSGPQEIVNAAEKVAECVRAGGKVLAFGNGGSATDAQDLVTDLLALRSPGRSVPAVSLTNDAAVVTAVANDVGFENVFARQVISHGAESDVAVAISTSGGSRNVVAAMEEAKRRGLLTVGLAGYGGGALIEVCDHGLVVHGDYIPRIQEAQATQYHLMLRVLAGLL